MTYQANSGRMRPRTRTAVGGALAAAALALASPAAGTAFAHGDSTNSGDAVGRPGLPNPAPGLRVAQAIGDHIYNQKTPLNKLLDDSPLGQTYHERFGTPNYDDPTHGSNGSTATLLNDSDLPRFLWDLAGFPDEKDLPGNVIRAFSGNQSSGSGGHHDDDDAAHDDDDHHAATSLSAKNCVSAVGGTTLSAHGTC